MCGSKTYKCPKCEDYVKNMNKANHNGAECDTIIKKK